MLRVFTLFTVELSDSVIQNVIYDRITIELNIEAIPILHIFS